MTKKIKKRNEIGLVFLKCSFNNTIVTITDQFGNVVAWASGGSCGFKGARKSTPFASKCASLVAAKLRCVQRNLDGLKPKPSSWGTFWTL